MNIDNTWTTFYDMHSGGRQKLKYPVYAINLPKEEAIRYFEIKFKRNPDHVTCNCCGEDYYVNESTEEQIEKDYKYHDVCYINVEYGTETVVNRISEDIND